ncbi:hypothetical protein [Spirosoma pulveris]
MPFQQPSSTTIRSYHFRDHEYTFPVESTIGPEEGAGQLLIDVSPGYLLFTSAETTPKSSQTLNYVLQADGSYLVREIVTLLATGPGLISGSVTLRDPTNEVLILDVAIETQLFTSHSAITFPPIESGGSVSVALTINQQGTHTPIVLSTNNPQQFTLATAGENPYYAESLTLIPAFEGSTIYVRYTPTRFGRHTAHLLIQTPYTTRTLPLQGPVGGWLGLFKEPVRQLPNEASIRQSPGRVVQKPGLLILLALAGLAGIAYFYWSSLGASRHPLPSAVNSDVTPSASRAVSGSVSASHVPVREHLPAPIERNKTQEETKQANQSTNLTSQPTPSDSGQKLVTRTAGGSGYDLTKVPHSAQKRKRRIVPDSISNQNLESELEKELNQKKNR